jgi:WG containing repeat
MMRNFLFSFSIILSPLALIAQPLNKGGDNQLAVAGVSTVTLASGRTVVAMTFAEAKLEYINAIKKLDFLKKEVPHDGVDFGNPQAFKDYANRAGEAIRRRIKELESDPTQVHEYNNLNQVASMLNSMSCLEDKKDGNFVRQKDLDGQEIVAFPLDSLRTNARYGLVESYKEGFARIKKDQVIGFLNVCGDEIIPCQYETGDYFNGGRALVKKVVWYFVDGSNNESDALFNIVDAKALTQGISQVKFKDGKSALINNKYDVTKKPISGLYDEIRPFFGKEVFKVKLGNLYGLISLQGQVLVSPNLTFIEPSGVSHLYRMGQNGKIGLIDTLWKVKFDPMYSQILDFDANGIAWAQTEGGISLLHSKSYKTSKVYKSVAPFNKMGIAQMMDANNLNGLINTNLDVIIDPRYASISDFNEYNLSAVSGSDKKYGFINTKGEEIIKPLFDEVGKFNAFGVVVVKEDYKDFKNKTYKVAQIYNKFGQAVITKVNDTLGINANVNIMYEFVDTLMNKKYVVVKKTLDNVYVGSHLIEIGSYRLVTPLPYQEITEFDDAAIMRYKFSNLWGMMDTTGKVILQPTYLEIRKPGEGYYAVKEAAEEKYGFIDKRGKIQIPFEYADVKTYKKGNCVVKLKDKQSWGMINKFNAKVVPCFFKTVNILEDKIEMFDDKQNKYVIDDKGDCLENCTKFEDIRRKANSGGK